jgi:hypothetical protein
MVRKKPLAHIALGLLFSLHSPIARAADPSIDELREQIRQLQQRVAQLEQAQNRATTQSIEATKQQVARDASAQSQIIPPITSIGAGYHHGFFIKSSDGNYSLHPGVQFQFRSVTNSRSDGTDDLENGFEIRRLRLRLEGNLFSPDLTYSFVWDTARTGGTVSLLDGWAMYHFAPIWSVKLGQFRESWTHEGDVPDTSQLAVERSLVDATLGGSLVDRVQGVALVYGAKTSPLRVETTYHDGANSKNTDFRDEIPGPTPSSAPVFDESFGFGGRVEYKAFGDWLDYRDFTAKGTKQPLLVFGTGFDYTEFGSSDVIRPTVDAQYENPNGFAAYGALNGVVTKTTGDDRFDWGALLQAGYLVRPAWEIFARYDEIFIDEDFVTGNNVFPEMTVGVNYYFGPNGDYLHRAKFTLDLNYLPQGVPVDVTSIGALAGDGNQFILRAQLTLQI